MKNLLDNLKAWSTKHKVLSYIVKNTLLFILAYFVLTNLFIFYSTVDNTKIGTINNCVIYTNDISCKEDIMRVMETCMMDLKEKNITVKSKIRIIFCTTPEQYNKKTLYLAKGSLGSNRTMINLILLAPADYKNNIQNKSDENLINRKLSDAVMHEITHTYIKEQTSFFKNLYLQLFMKWKSEGFCDYIANSSSLNISDGKRIFIENGEEQKQIQATKDIWYYTYFYFTSRLKADYLFSYKKISFDEFFSTKFDETALENEIREKLLSGEYVFNKQ